MMHTLNKINLHNRFSFGRVNPIVFLPITAACILLLWACVMHPPSQTPVLNQPETKNFDVQSSVLMKALVRVLTDKKFKVNAERTGGQSLETEWLQDGSYRSMVLAEVLPLEKFRSQLKVTLLLQKKPFLQESWQPMDKIDKTVYKDFMNDVLIESYRVLYDRR
ncbi:MAG: hypothetical protein P1P89_16850 [Desulfobacterales bacterium]|nr:hypothetical protein [Desulfobacterales bacterium]